MNRQNELDKLVKNHLKGDSVPFEVVTRGFWR